MSENKTTNLYLLRKAIMHETRLPSNLILGTISPTSQAGSVSMKKPKTKTTNGTVVDELPVCFEIYEESQIRPHRQL
jgi:hypothetical protein